jgi:hypothetical protein
VPKFKPKALKLEELGSNLDPTNFQKGKTRIRPVFSNRRNVQ